MRLTVDRLNFFVTLDSLSVKGVKTIDLVAHEGKLLFISPRSQDEVEAIIDEPGAIHNVLIDRVSSILSHVPGDDLTLMKTAKNRLRAVTPNKDIDITVILWDC